MYNKPLTLSLANGIKLSATLCQPNAHPPQHLVILLHGWGADSTDLIPLAPALIGNEETRAVLIPDAPDICTSTPFGRQWFALADRTPNQISTACTAATPLIGHLIDSLCTDLSLTSPQIIVGGFSQGGMMALSGGLIYAQPLGGLFCLSGAWPTPDLPSHQPKNLPIMLVHGDADPIVPYQAMYHAENALKQQDFTPQTHLRPALAHSIDQPVIDLITAFLG